MWTNNIGRGEAGVRGGGGGVMCGALGRDVGLGEVRRLSPYVASRCSTEGQKMARQIRYTQCFQWFLFYLI